MDVSLLRLSLFSLLVLPQAFSAVSLLSQEEICFHRCKARCVNTRTVNTSATLLFDCGERCQKYRTNEFCNGDEDCLSTCSDLGAPSKPSAPSSPKYSRLNDGGVTISWNTVADAVYYVVQYKLKDDSGYAEDMQMESTSPTVTNFSVQKINFCDSFSIRVLAVSENGVSSPSTELIIPPPSPSIIDPKMEVEELKYLNEPFRTDFYEANGTILLTLEFVKPDWRLGAADLEVTPMFHMINCEEPDLSQGVPVPEFLGGPLSNTVQTKLGSDMMTRSCRFVYYVQSMKSLQCRTTSYEENPPADALQTLDINCDTVEGSPCKQVDVYPPPLCGQTLAGNYSPVWDSVPNTKDNKVMFPVNYTIVPASTRMSFEYWVAFYGPAIEFKTSSETEFMGVNMTKVTGNTTTCSHFSPDGHCLNHTGNWVLIPEVHWNLLYGVMFCGVRDVRNLTFPGIGGGRATKLRAERIFVDRKAYQKDHTGLIVGLVVGLFVLFSLLIIAFCIYRNRKQALENRKFQIKLAQMEREKENRYTEFPKKQDIWEIERRNLIIYDDKKLGSGAFGAVYLGKLIGTSLGHKDANSPLGINLLRAENCDVAVKMLPEFADEESRAEFLREIALMKNLGYHERLVNLLACVTETDPLCLVVEYCNDGDLLKFLQDRCKYMIKLDELSVNYREPTEEDEFDETMILTMKQLLQFSVQIAFGLEYLSQKGFVHRDVAARNVLVSNNNSAKIGDFGLCRHIYTESNLYKSRPTFIRCPEGGRLPLKWMSPEAIRHYEFSTKSDVWSFGILLFEVITLGGSPYPNIPPDDMLDHMEEGGVMEQPDNCPDEFYSIMMDCWNLDPAERPEFAQIRQKLALQLEEVTEEYSYLKLDAGKDYYNVSYADKNKEIVIVPENKAVITSPTVEQKNFIENEENLEKEKSNENPTPIGVLNPAYQEDSV